MSTKGALDVFTKMLLSLQLLVLVLGGGGGNRTGGSVSYSWFLFVAIQVSKSFCKTLVVSGVFLSKGDPVDSINTITTSLAEQLLSFSCGLALALAPFSYPAPRNSFWLHRNSFSQTLPSNGLALAPPSPTRVSRQGFWRPGLAPSKESRNTNCKSTCM